MSGEFDLVRHVAGFIRDPGDEVVIVFNWLSNGPLTFVGVQRLKRLAFASGKEWTPLRIETVASIASFSISMLIMHGLYYIDLRTAAIHAVLITWIYMFSVNWWLEWAKKNRPDAWQAARTRRRASDDGDDTGDFMR